MIYIYIYYVLVRLKKNWLAARKRLYHYMHTGCTCHTCCFSKSRIALIFYCTLVELGKFFIGVFHTNVANQLSVLHQIS